MGKMPADVKKMLAKDAKAKAAWAGLTPIARRDFISWVESAKQPATRTRRIESIPSRLVSGKRRICCYAVVPLDLYSAQRSLPKAKKQWSTLTADEKRDFTDWIQAANDKAARTKRIEQACAKLLLGKRHP